MTQQSVQISQSQETNPSNAIINKFQIIYGLKDIENIYVTDFFACQDKYYNLFIWGGIWGSTKPSLLREFEKNVLQASIGESLLIVIDLNLMVYSCGKNNVGQLGLKDVNQITTLTCIESLMQNPIKLLECGKDFCIGISGL